MTPAVKFSLWSAVVALISVVILILGSFFISGDWLISVSVAFLFVALMLVVLRLFFVRWVGPYREFQLFIDEKLKGQENLAFNPSNAAHPVAHIGLQFEQLLRQFGDTKTNHYLYGLINDWPWPVAMFDDTNQLIGFNPKMSDALDRALIRGMSAEECGFVFQANQCIHTAFGDDWIIKRFALDGGVRSLVTATNIGQSIQEARYESNTSLIRVLTHELNNSLTPFVSLTDTLLSATHYSDDQVKQVLSRINKRSESLLKFIHDFGQLNRVPLAKCDYFDLVSLARQNADELGLTLTCSGYEQCYADPILIEQMLINLFKNAKEANAQHIELSCWTKGRNQMVSVVDDGPGFNDPIQALQPLYTTKSNGQGLGLAFCHNIIHRHHGTLRLANVQPHGAKIEMTLPVE